MATKKPAKAKGPGRTGPRWDRSTAEEVFAAYFTLRGFDVERFDTWLASLGDCGAKVELTERRELAIATFQKDPDNKDSTLRHLEWIQRRWAEIRREEFLLPLAREGKGLKDARSEGGRSTAEQKRANNSRRDEQLATRARALIQANGATLRTVAAKLIENGMNQGLGIKRVREILRERGVR